MIDEAESRAIVGRTDLKIEELAGRGLVKIDEPTIFQTALPTNGEDVLTRIENIQAEGKEMDSFWDGKDRKQFLWYLKFWNTRNSLHGQKQEKLLKQAN